MRIAQATVRESVEARADGHLIRKLVFNWTAEDNCIEFEHF